jgi:hypothetical protein
MGASYCYGQNTNTTVNNDNEHKIDLAGLGEPLKSIEKDQKQDDIQIDGFPFNEEKVKTIQSVMRGYLARKGLQKPLFDVKELRTWFKVEDHFKLAQKPITEHQNDRVGAVEKNLGPLAVQRPNDGVKVVAKPAVILNDGSVYEGEWDKNGNKHGIGTLVQQDGSKLIGSFKAGEFEGLGRLIQNSGTLYEGEFKQGKLNGNAKILRQEGAKFDGELVDGKIHGKGVEEWPDGTRYEGDYFYGARQGKGKLLMADGSVYKGNFFENKMEGKGEIQSKNGNRYKGDWKDNKMHGQGVFNWNDGRVYQGSFENDLRHGKGKMTWTDGRVYDGEWSQGNQHGTAIYTFLGKDNKFTTKKGRWDQGSRVEWLE